MRIFVAGATGAIGRRLIPVLVAQGHEVTALIRRTNPFAERAQTLPDTENASTGRDRTVAGSVRTVVADVYDAPTLREVVAAARPDVVVHQLTDLTSRDFAANGRIRREGTRNLVDAALFAGVRRVISQSIAWAYEPGDTPAVESTPLDLSATDDRRRATVEAVATLERITAEAPEWVVLRYGTLYGPDTWYTKGALMADLAAAGDLATGPDITSFLHVDDAAFAAAAALHWPTGAVNIVDDTPAPASDWIPAFAKSVGAPAPATSPDELASPVPPAPSAAAPAASPDELASPVPPAPSAAAPAASPDEPASPVPPAPSAAAPATSPDEPASPAPSAAAPTRTPWARGASNTHARTHLGWTPTHPTWRTGFGS